MGAALRDGNDATTNSRVVVVSHQGAVWTQGWRYTLRWVMAEMLQHFVCVRVHMEGAHHCVVIK